MIFNEFIKRNHMTQPIRGNALSKSRERFCQLVADGTEPIQACISAGYKPSGAKQCATRLFKEDAIQKRVAEIQQAARQTSARSAMFSRKRVLNRLSELSFKAEQRGHYAAAIHCEELIGREQNMFVLRPHEVWDGDLAKLTDDQLATLLKNFAGIHPALEEEEKLKKQPLLT